MFWRDSLGQFLITHQIGAMILWHEQDQFCSGIFTVWIRYLSTSRASFFMTAKCLARSGMYENTEQKHRHMKVCIWQKHKGFFFLLTWTLLLSCPEVTIRVLRCNFSLIKERQHCKRQRIIWRKCKKCGMGGILPPWLRAVELRPVSEVLWTSFLPLWGGHKYLPLLPLKGWCRSLSEL